ncbi:hypothetical protein D3C77_661730 [compost metagenome]
MVDVLICRHQCAAAVILIHLAIAKHIASLHKLADKLYAALIIRGKVVTIRKMERVDVPVRSWVTRINNL